VPKFFLNNTEINPPQNYQELELELNFDRDRPEGQQTVSINNWDFVRENTDKLQDIIDGGLTGGTGIFEAPTFGIELPECGRYLRPFDGYLDFTDEHTISCIKTTVTAKERKGIDWLNDVADGVTFEYLYSIGKITKADFIYQPYVINSIPDYKEVAITMISVYVAIDQIQEATLRLSILIPRMANPLEASSIVEAIILIAYIALLILAIIKLIKDIVQMIIQPVKYHAGMNVLKQLEIGAAHFGMSFKSDILSKAPYNKLTILPEKYLVPKNKKDDRILGITTPLEIDQFGYYKGTYGDLLRALKIMFNGKILIKGSEIHLLRRDKSTSTPQYTLPDLYQPEYRLNTNELKSNYLIAYETDVSDKNTIQEYTGTSYQIITQPKTFVNRDLVLMRGLSEQRIPFALAKRKTELTIPEKIFDAFAKAFGKLINAMVKVVNAIIKLANKIIKLLNKILKALKTIGINLNFEIKPIPPLKTSDIGNIIGNRIGMMKLENDQYTRPKIYLLEEGASSKFNKVSTSTAINAKYLYDNYHFIESFAPTTSRPNANQYVIKEYKNVPFCCEDYLKVKDNNIIFVGNDIGEVNSLKWNIYDEKADMVIRINKLYTNNLKEIALEPTGE